MYRIRIIFSLLVMILFITACQDDRNTLGTGLDTQLPIVAKTNIDSLLYFSYDSDLNIVSGETNIICANNNSLESIILMNFYNMPTETDSLSDAILKISIIEEKSSFNAEDLKLGLIKRNWRETATWESPYPDSTNSVWDVTSDLVINGTYCTNSFHVDGDSLGITIPKDLIDNWVIEDINGYNLALIIQDGYVAIKSSETSYGPKLSFDYKKNDETNKYNSECLYDTYIIENNNDKQVYDKQVFLQNIKPVRSFVKFDIEETILSMNGINQSNLNKLLLNKAELVFHIDKDNTEYYSEENEDYNELEIDLLWPENEINEPMVIENDDLDTNIDDTPYPYYLLRSSTVEIADSLATIDISPIVENYLKGRMANHGFVMYNTEESVFFGKITLDDFDVEDSLKPYLKIIYTIPEEE